LTSSKSWKNTEGVPAVSCTDLLSSSRIVGSPAIREGKGMTRWSGDTGAQADQASDISVFSLD
jgi:hypothetical protein